MIDPSSRIGLTWQSEGIVNCVVRVKVHKERPAMATAGQFDVLDGMDAAHPLRTWLSE